MSYFKYDKFFALIDKKKVKVTDMWENNVMPRASYKGMRENNVNITTKTICNICDYLNCKPKDIMEFVKGDKDDIS